jgi:hypothetical protein
MHFNSKCCEFYVELVPKWKKLCYDAMDACPIWHTTNTINNLLPQVGLNLVIVETYLNFWLHLLMNPQTNNFTFGQITIVIRMFFHFFQFIFLLVHILLYKGSLTLMYLMTPKRFDSTKLDINILDLHNFYRHGKTNSNKLLPSLVKLSNVFKKVALKGGLCKLKLLGVDHQWEGFFPNEYQDIW